MMIEKFVDNGPFLYFAQESCIDYQVQFCQFLSPNLFSLAWNKKLYSQLYKASIYCWASIKKKNEYDIERLKWSHNSFLSN